MAPAPSDYAAPAPAAPAADPGFAETVLPVEGIDFAQTVLPEDMASMYAMPQGAVGYGQASMFPNAALDASKDSSQPVPATPVASHMVATTGTGTGTGSAATPPPTTPLPSTPPSLLGSGNNNGSNNNPKRPPIIWIVVAAVAVILIVIGVVFGVSRANSNASHTVETSTAASPGKSHNNGADDAGKDESDEEAKSCTALPDAILDTVKLSGESMVAKLELAAPSCKDARYEESDVRVTLKDDDGDVIAAAVYDFADKPITFASGEATVSLAFDINQYWRPVGQIDDDDVSVVWQSDAERDGNAAADVDGALGGANISNDDCEKYAQAALSTQLTHDKSDASDFYYTYTDQLSSKRFGMEIEGKSWTYTDIYRHFLKMQIKHPKALLIWAADYYNYTKHNHDADYYVILCGESFSDIKAAEAWCTRNGYGSADCIPVDLQ
ncbi:hypothetical protein [Bifidobacterium gallicum]|uniref:hypothetical protein n=1 Tax=Bifidobacterium gallicum TaxID=78342 RepID=UPI001EE68EDF|nr:hypothetical protein [Bifidobacterium gallicum]